MWTGDRWWLGSWLSLKQSCSDLNEKKDERHNVNGVKCARDEKVRVYKCKRNQWVTSDHGSDYFWSFTWGGEIGHNFLLLSLVYVSVEQQHKTWIKSKAIYCSVT